jgi:hypothetical protein
MRANVTMATSAAACVSCPAGRFSAVAGASDDVDVDVCRPCAPHEGSRPAAVACWPGVAFVNASNPPPLVVGYSLGDTVTVGFTRDVDAYGAAIESLFSFSPGIGTLHTTWPSERTLVATVVSTDGVADAAAVDIGELNATLLPTASVRSSDGLSDASPSVTVRVGGTWGEPSAPRLFRIVAVDAAWSDGIQRGDRMRVVFDQPVLQRNVSSAAAVDELFQLTPSLQSSGATYHGEWLNRSSLDVVFDSPMTSSAAATFVVGAVVVSTRPSAALRSANGQSDVSNSSLLLSEGSWGDVPAATLDERSSSSLRVALSPPQNHFGYAVTRYVVAWCDVTACNATSSLPRSFRDIDTRAVNVSVSLPLPLEAGVGAVMDVVVVDTVAGVSGIALLTLRGSRIDTAVFDITDLVPGVLYSVAVACNNLEQLGPFVPTAPAELAPSNPRISSVTVAARSLLGSGGDLIAVEGSRLGDAASQSVTLLLRNGVYSLTSPSCTSPIPLRRLLCVAPAGAGVGYRVAVVVDGAQSAWFTPLSPLSYAPPVVTGFGGEGAESSTTGGDVVLLRGANFGSASMWPLPLQSVGYEASGLRYSYLASNCSVTRDHEEVTCSTGAGVGARLLWTVTVAGQSSTNPHTRYHTPVVHSVSITGGGHGAGSFDATSNLMDTRGGHEMVVRGAYFGPASPSLLTSVEGVGDADAAAPGGRILRGDNCTITVAHETIVCQTPAGVGTGYRWRVTVAGQASLLSSEVASFRVPNVTSVLVNGRRSTPTAGGALLTFTGSQFGVDNAAVTVLWNGVALPGVYVSTPHTAVSVAALPGQGPPVSLALLVAGQRASLSPSLSLMPFDAPHVLELQVADVEGVQCLFGAVTAASMYSLVIKGSSFGFGNETSVTVSGTPCAVHHDRTSHDVAVCTTQMCGGERSRQRPAFVLSCAFLLIRVRCCVACAGSVVVCVTGQCSNAVSYDFNRLVEVPRILGIIPNNGPTAGGTVIRIIGERFRSVGNVSFVDVDAALSRSPSGWRSCDIVTYSDTEIR